MRFPSVGLAVAVGGVSVAAGTVAVAIAQVELGGQAAPKIWTNGWLLGALALAGSGLLFTVVSYVVFAQEPTI
jgi:hypothetical protein